ncbi:hypothetical protein [Laspinema palackyanum]
MQPRMTVDNGFSFIVADGRRRSHPVPTLHGHHELGVFYLINFY